MTGTAVEPPQLMTENHTRTLLAVLVSLDPRLKAPDETTAAIRCRAWTSLLAEVDPVFAAKFVEHAYQQVRDWPLQPAEILQAWRTEAAEAREEATQEQRVIDRSDRRATIAVGQQYLRDCWAAVLAGQEPPPRPPDLNTLTPEQDARQRRCTYYDLCACDHTRCRNGYLDAEAVVIGVHGVEYPGVQRCSFCRDALLMAEEQGRAVSPGRHGGRRR